MGVYRKRQIFLCCHTNLLARTEVDVRSVHTMTHMVRKTLYFGIFQLPIIIIIIIIIIISSYSFRSITFFPHYFYSIRLNVQVTYTANSRYEMFLSKRTISRMFFSLEVVLVMPNFMM
jgi:hypothetical protein